MMKYGNFIEVYGFIYITIIIKKIKWGNYGDVRYTVVDYLIIHPRLLSMSMNWARNKQN